MSEYLRFLFVHPQHALASRLSFPDFAKAIGVADRMFQVPNRSDMLIFEITGSRVQST